MLWRGMGGIVCILVFHWYGYFLFLLYFFHYFSLHFVFLFCLFCLLSSFLLLLPSSIPSNLEAGKLFKVAQGVDLGHQFLDVAPVPRARQQENHIVNHVAVPVGKSNK